MTPKPNHSEIKRYRDINLVAIEYLLQETAGHVKWDDFDPAIQRCQKLKSKTEKLYLTKNLQGLEKLVREITKERQLMGDLNFENYIKERTGYQIDIFENLKKSSRQRNHSQNENHYRRQLYGTDSPDHKYKLIVSESGSDLNNVVTQVSLISEKVGASVYIANGIDLGIMAHWRDNNTIVIETKAICEVVSRRIQSLQIFDHVFKINLIEN